MILTKQSASGDYIVFADLSVPSLEIRHILSNDSCDAMSNFSEVLVRYVGRPNYNNISFVKRMFKNLELQ